MESSSEGGQVLIRLRDNPDLGREVRAYKRTEKYLKTKSDSTLPESGKRILRDNAEENRERRKLLTTLVAEMLVEASYFVAGQPVKVQGKAPGRDRCFFAFRTIAPGAGPTRRKATSSWEETKTFP